VPGPITLTNTGSTDPDGEIASTAWNFGDSSSGSGASATHTYSTTGIFEVTMTVTDNSGSTAVKTHKITAVPAMSVDTITAGKTTASGRLVANATVKIVDAADAPIEGAAVSVTYTYGTKKATGSGRTGADGTVLLKGPTAAAGTVVTATVTKVTFNGKAFNPGLSNANVDDFTL
jgi:PKD repeat protein